MCGIFGYVGNRDAVDLSVKGLKQLEYRGYDSSGIAGIDNGTVRYCKETGKIAALEAELAKVPLRLNVAIAQTRWATHGQPSRANAHPHLDSAETLALVHNGIIENYLPIREALQDKGVAFISDTDTEVIAHLIASHYSGDMVETLLKVVPQLKGAYALAIVHKDYPDVIFAIAHDTPLVVGIGDNEAFIASDSNAFAEHTRKVLFLNSGEIAVIKASNLEIFDTNRQSVAHSIQTIPKELTSSSKEGYEHYTLKEIHEQPLSTMRAMDRRLDEAYGTAIFSEIAAAEIDLLAIERIVILACGSSWHAGSIAAYMIEEYARLPVQVEISSEYRYKNPVILPGTLAIAISQSGETADTLAAMRELKARGARIVGICNVPNSSLVREADVCLQLYAGSEIGVCSTKAFTSQLVVLSLLALMLGRIRHLSKTEGQQFIQALKLIPKQISQVLSLEPAICDIARKYAKYENFFFLGRHYMYPSSLEGALKLKEISYINANGYPAGEMKHGPIALINQQCPTVALCANGSIFEKMQSNLMEIKARHGLIVAITTDKYAQVVADDVIVIPSNLDALTPISVAVVTQLLAYYIAKERGSDIDQPRNLAKSVTVE